VVREPNSECKLCCRDDETPLQLIRECEALQRPRGLILESKEWNSQENGPIPHIIFLLCFNDWNRKNRVKKLIFHILEEKIMVVNVSTLV